MPSIGSRSAPSIKSSSLQAAKAARPIATLSARPGKVRQRRRKCLSGDAIRELHPDLTLNRRPSPQSDPVTTTNAVALSPASIPEFLSIEISTWAQLDDTTTQQAQIA